MLPRDQTHAARLAEIEAQLAHVRTEQAALLAALVQETGERLAPALLPSYPASHWSDAAKRLHARLRFVGDEFARLNSQRCSLQLGRFLEAAETNTLTPELTAWWQRRY